jgi:flagellum-specific peptidoglycan hydrolase FlgJ
MCLTARATPIVRRVAVVGLVGAIALTSVVTAAGAQETPPTTEPPTVTSPATDPPPPAEVPAAPSTTTTTTTTPKVRTAQEQQLVDATIRLYRMRADLADLDRSLADVSERLAVAEAALAATEAKLTDARTQLVDVRSTLQSRAAVVYQRHSDRLSMALSVDKVVNLSAGNHYADSVAAVDNREISRLQAVIAELSAQRSQQDAIRRDLAEQKSQVERSHADLQASVDREQAEIDALGGVPIMGQALLTGAEIAAWFTSTGQRARLMNDTPIDDLAEMYVSEGNAENVRGDIAFAQAVLETGSFGHAQDNNFAGIGACDSCTSQYLFPTPRDGVRAQIQLLRNYADPFSRASMLTNPLDATLHGRDPVRAAQAFDTFSFKGRAPVWNVMGAGNWATDPLYAGKVLGIYSKMLTFKAALPK